MPRVLMVCTTHVPQPQLLRQVRPHDANRLVVPVVRQGLLDWLANDQRAFAAAEEIAGHVADGLPTEPVAASAGESDVSLAIRDALATYPADEIVIAFSQEDEVALDGATPD